MGAVVEEEVLLGVTGGEVGAEQGEDPVFRRDLSHQDPVSVGEADGAGEEAGLLVQVLHRLADPVYHRMGRVLEGRRSPVAAQAEELPQPQLPLGQTGEKAVGDQLRAGAAQAGG